MRPRSSPPCVSPPRPARSVAPHAPRALLPCVSRAPCCPTRPARPAAPHAPRVLLPHAPRRPAGPLALPPRVPCRLTRPTRPAAIRTLPCPPRDSLPHHCPASCCRARRPRCACAAALPPLPRAAALLPALRELPPALPRTSVRATARAWGVAASAAA
ncbi:unnamed protein product [Closterium sp. Naga37s-1]|nr:unnamed protein product [Closterium sp. Naga37s-1]